MRWNGGERLKDRNAKTTRKKGDKKIDISIIDYVIVVVVACLLLLGLWCVYKIFFEPLPLL